MGIGENAKSDDLEVNPLKSKQLTNFRASGKDDALRLTPPKRLTLEQAIAYIDDDELVEVTHKSIRLRKLHLDPHERKRASRRAAASRQKHPSRPFRRCAGMGQVKDRPPDPSVG